MMVPEAGLEPARYFYRGILSPLCLPIPPLGLNISILLTLKPKYGHTFFSILTLKNTNAI